MANKTLITGGTGWIGRHLIPALESPLLVTRNAESAIRNTGLPANQILQCDLNQSSLPAADLRDVEAIVNLTGESIAEGRWTEAKKKRIRDSRVNSTRHLVESVLQSGTLPRVLVSASAIGIYGDHGNSKIDELTEPGDDFLADICVEWEQSTAPLKEAGVRVCHLRIGIVVGEGGGAIATMLPVFRMGLGGRIGSGKQWMSWVHLNDLVRMILWLIDQDQIQGPINATAPHPVTNRDFTKVLAATLNRPAVLPVPPLMLRIALGEFARFLSLSQRVLPTALLNNGFEFQFEHLEDALQDILKSADSTAEDQVQP